MENLSAIEKIDKVLEVLNDYENGTGKLGYATPLDLYSRLWPKFNITNKEFIAIMITLIEDRNAYKEEESNGKDVYFATWRGQFFALNGGYIGENNRKHAENDRILNLEKLSRSNQRWMLLLTILVAFGSLFSGIWYAIGLWKYFVHHILH